MLLLVGTMLVASTAQCGLSPRKPAPHGKPPGGGYFRTEPRGFVPLSDGAAAARVHRSSWEPRLDNTVPNQVVPVKGRDFNNGVDGTNYCIGLQQPACVWRMNNISGNFTGTTDEILQWAAAKWGIADDIIRAAAVNECDWHMSENGDNGESFGILQVRRGADNKPGTWPASRDSTAFNADYWGWWVRSILNGYCEWCVNIPPGSIWDAMGSWFNPVAGTYDDYVRRAQDNMRRKPWLYW